MRLLNVLFWSEGQERARMRTLSDPSQLKCCKYHTCSSTRIIDGDVPEIRYRGQIYRLVKDEEEQSSLQIYIKLCITLDSELDKKIYEIQK